MHDDFNSMKSLVPGPWRKAQSETDPMPLYEARVQKWRSEQLANAATNGSGSLVNDAANPGARKGEPGAREAARTEALAETTRGRAATRRILFPHQPGMGRHGGLRREANPTKTIFFDARQKRMAYSGFAIASESPAFARRERLSMISS